MGNGTVVLRVPTCVRHSGARDEKARLGVSPELVHLRSDARTSLHSPGVVDAQAGVNGGLVEPVLRDGTGRDGLDGKDGVFGGDAVCRADVEAGLVEVSLYFSGQGPVIGDPIDAEDDLPLFGGDDHYQWWRFRIHARGCDAASAMGDIFADDGDEVLEHLLSRSGPPPRHRRSPAQAHRPGR
ncbi:hypothetical protein ABZ419_31660 [Streptomyces cinnamoneus]|uniref:hypothetical protein n=1 Tax=Streptomyces cinnamoneus TaxID=53446 RepID=UPI0033C49781